MEKILITGVNGFLGQHLAAHLNLQGFHVIGTNRGASRLHNQTITYENIDLINEVAVSDLLNKYQPEVIIHTAAMSKPDECLSNQAMCLQTNVDATRYLTRFQSTKFIYISTDFIFGDDGPHAEQATPDPLNFYGASKLQAEQVVIASGLSYAIVRPVFIYGKVWEGLRPTFLHWVKNSLEQGKPIKVVSDQLRTPTFVTDICKGISAIINRNATGAYHLAGRDILSPYQMAVITAEVLNLDGHLIENVTSETFPEPVRRAKKSGLLINKAMAHLDYNPVTFKEGVALTFDTN